MISCGESKRDMVQYATRAQIFTLYTMGIFSILTQMVVLSSVFAGLRRYSGLSIQKLIEPKITNDYAKIASKAFFDVGEVVVKKGTELLENAKPPKPPHARE